MDHNGVGGEPGQDQDEIRIELRGEGDGGVESGLRVQDGLLWDLCLNRTGAGWAQNWNQTIGIQTRWKQNQDWIGMNSAGTVTGCDQSELQWQWGKNGVKM